MNINIKRFKELLETDFENNLHECARRLNMSPSTICRIIKGEINGGRKFILSLMSYCKASGADFEEFLLLN